MRGYLSVSGDTSRIPIDERTEVYRDPDSQSDSGIVAEKKGRKIALGVSDVTVSRKKNGSPPVVIEPKENFIEIHNNGNSNGVTVRTSSEKKEVKEGCVETVQSDTTISLGYNAEFRLTVETVAEVTNIEHKGDGDIEYVDGDKTVKNVDKSTEVGEDAVVNRLNTHNEEKKVAEGGSEDTMKYCERHEIAYEGEVCPRCR
jgi:hypothetical protein